MSYGDSNAYSANQKEITVKFETVQISFFVFFSSISYDSASHCPYF